MKLLPTSEWQVRFYPDFVAIAAHTNCGGLYWTKYKMSDFPQETIGLDDLPLTFTRAVQGILDASK